MVFIKYHKYKGNPIAKELINDYIYITHSICICSGLILIIFYFITQYQHNQQQQEQKSKGESNEIKPLPNNKEANGLILQDNKDNNNDGDKSNNRYIINNSFHFGLITEDPMKIIEVIKTTASSIG